MPGNALQTNAATAAPPQPSAPAAAQPAPAGVRSSLGSFGTRLAASPRAQNPGIIPQQRPGMPPVAPPDAPTDAAPPSPAVIAPAVAARSLAAPGAAPTTADGVVTPKPTVPVLGKGGAPIPGEAVSDRVARERNRILRAEYGTTDPAEIAKIKSLRLAQADEYTTLKKQKEDADRLAMSEQQRQTADLEALRTQNAELQSRLHEMETGQVVNSQTQELTKVAGKYIDPSMMEYALGDFQRYVNKLDPKEVKRVTPRSIERWFVKLAEEKPRFRIVPVDPNAGVDPTLGTAAVGVKGVDSPGPSPATIVVPKTVRRVPITTSTAPKGGAPKPVPKKPEGGTVAGKTVRPGMPNSMTSQELKSHLRAQGRQPW